MNLPQPRTTDQQLMAAVCGLLVTQNDLLTEIRDRLSDRSGGGQPASESSGGGVVELKEPAAPPPAAVPDEPAPVAPAAPKPARRTAAKKTTAAERRTGKGTS